MRRKLKIPLEGLSLEARIRVSPVIGGEVRWLLNGPRQETCAKGAVRDKADAQLATCRKSAVALHIPRPKRISFWRAATGCTAVARRRVSIPGLR